MRIYLVAYSVAAKWPRP